MHLFTGSICQHGESMLYIAHSGVYATSAVEKKIEMSIGIKYYIYLQDVLKQIMLLVINEKL